MDDSRPSAPLPESRVDVSPSGLMSRESWKIFRIMAEFVAGFEPRVHIAPSVGIFGLARTAPGHPYYALSGDIARKPDAAAIDRADLSLPTLVDTAEPVLDTIFRFHEASGFEITEQIREFTLSL